MANLKNIRDTINRLASKAVASGSAEGKLGYETFLSVEFDTSLATPGLRVTFRHHSTEIVKAHIRPQGLATTPAKLYRLTVANGGFRSPTTYDRLAEILAVFGVRIQRRYGRDALNGDRVYARDGTWEAPFGARLYVTFKDDGVTPYSWDDSSERAYPDSDEAAAIDWLFWFTTHGELYDVRNLMADIYYATRKDDGPYMGYANKVTQRADYMRRYAGPDYLRGEMQGLRRAFAQHYGSSRDGLDVLLEAWREAGCPDAKGKPARLEQYA